MVSGRTENIEIRTSSESGTEALGFEMGLRISRGITILLIGSLGAGKSVLARGICKGLGVEESVISPSFILYEEYRGRLPVVHCDLYRLEHERELEELGIFERIGPDVVLVAEWGDRSERLTEIADVVVHLRMATRMNRIIEINCQNQDKHLFEGHRT